MLRITSLVFFTLLLAAVIATSEFRNSDEDFQLPLHLFKRQSSRQTTARTTARATAATRAPTRQGQGQGSSSGTGSSDFWVAIGRLLEQEQAGRPLRTSTTVRIATRFGEGDACVEACVTIERNEPVCGSDGQTYQSPKHLECAKSCGQTTLKIQYYRAC